MNCGNKIPSNEYLICPGCGQSPNIYSTNPHKDNIVPHEDKLEEKTNDKKSSLKFLWVFAAIIIISIAVFAIVMTSISSSNTAPTTEWITYNNNGITFQYPSTWNIQKIYANGDEIVVGNPNEKRGFTIGLPNQYLQSGASQYPNLREYASDVTSKIIGGGTITEDFTDKYFNGFPAASGKITNLDTKSLVALIDHNGQIYTFQYSDTADKFDTVESQQILDKVINSFGFT
jgi:hypothetical protein